MYLRSEKHIGVQGGPETASSIPTQGSRAFVTGRLESIAEQLSSDTYSESSSSDESMMMGLEKNARLG